MENLEEKFKDKEQFERVKIYRGLPFAYQGMKIELWCPSGYQEGYIVGGNSGCNLEVYFPKHDHMGNVHPYYMIRYFDKDNNIVKEYNGDYPEGTP